MDTRIILREPNSGVEVATINHPRELRCPHDAGRSIMQWKVPSDAPWLDQEVEAHLEVSMPAGSTFRPIGAAFDVLRIEGDPLSTDPVMTVTAASLHHRLAGAAVYIDPADAPVRDIGKPAQLVPRKFTGRNARWIMQTLVSEERGRGRLTGITVAGTGALTAIPEIEFKHGTTLEVALEQLVEGGHCRAEWVSSGTGTHTLQILPPAAPGGTPVELVVGRELADAPRTTTRENAATVAIVQGEGDATVEVTHGTPGPTGHRVVSLSAAGVTDETELERVGLRHLQQLARAQSQREATLALDHPQTPAVGTSLWLGTPVSLRVPRVQDGVTVTSTAAEGAVQQIVLTTNSQGVAQAAIVVGDKLTSYQARTAKERRAERGGRTPATGTIGTPKPPAEYMAPELAENLPWNPEWGEQLVPGWDENLPWNDDWGDMPGEGGGGGSEYPKLLAAEPISFNHSLGDGVKTIVAKVDFSTTAGHLIRFEVPKVQVGNLWWIQTPSTGRADAFLRLAAAFRPEDFNPDGTLRSDFWDFDTNVLIRETHDFWWDETVLGMNPDGMTIDLRYSDLSAIYLAESPEMTAVIQLSVKDHSASGAFMAEFTALGKPPTMLIWDLGPML